MSIGIYNGYILPKMSMEEMISFSKKHKEKIFEIVEVEFYTDLAKKFTIEYDINLIEPIRNLDLNLKKIIEVIIEDIKKNIDNSIIRNTRIDFDYESILYFLPNDTNTLVGFFCENENIQKYWNSIPNVKSYYYQNSNDKPKNISVKKWEKRYDDWKKALGGNFGSFSENGLKYTLSEIKIDILFFYRLEKMLKYIPTYDDRCEKIAKKIFINQYYKTHKDPNDPSLQTMLFFDAKEELKNNPNNDEYITILENIKNKLPKEITMDTIKNAMYVINEKLDIQV